MIIRFYFSFVGEAKLKIPDPNINLRPLVIFLTSDILSQSL